MVHTKTDSSESVFMCRLYVQKTALVTENLMATPASYLEMYQEVFLRNKMVMLGNKKKKRRIPAELV